jgi:deoxyribodipyrimidine photo-lyase
MYVTHQVKSYKQTRNQLIGAAYSTKFSPWLALGNISARQIVAEIRVYEMEYGSNESTYWVYFELLWREFFKLTARKYGDTLFNTNGFRGVKKSFPPQNQAFKNWCNGETGNAFVDANMKELLLTGFMSNRGRQNVASFLVHDLGVNWQLGAAWFEMQLLDYDVSSNWCNWQYIAGIGNDPRFRKFNVSLQQERYDPNLAYTRLWNV